MSVDEHVPKCSESMQLNHEDEVYEGLEKVFTISTFSIRLILSSSKNGSVYKDVERCFTHSLWSLVTDAKR